MMTTQVSPNNQLQRTGLRSMGARVRARLLGWHGRALEALRPAAELGR